MRRSLSLLALGALTALAVGSAAALTVDGGTIQAGVDSDLTCDANGVVVTGWGYEEDAGRVLNVAIGGIDPACQGDALFVTVTSAGASFTGEVAVLTPAHVEPGLVRVPFTPQLPEDITALNIVIEGGTP